MIFHVIHDSVTKEGEIVEECDARLAKNVDCQHHYDVEASREADEDGCGLPCHQRNMEDAFDMASDQLVY